MRRNIHAMLKDSLIVEFSPQFNLDSNFEMKGVEPMKTNRLVIFMVLTLTLAVPSITRAQGLVKITPLGSHDGEFCANDRALLFEDPTGLRILYDPGRSIAGGTDTRLGTVHVMILTSVHSDHIGDIKASGANVGSCATPGTVSAAPNSNFAEIAAAKKATVVVGGEMHTYLAARIAAASGAALAACPAVENLTVTDSPAAPRTCILRHGGKRIVQLGTAGEGVQIAVVRADHSNGVPRNLLSAGLAGDLTPDMLTAYAGPENGYVLTFTNG